MFAAWETDNIVFMILPTRYTAMPIPYEPLPPKPERKPAVYSPTAPTPPAEGPREADVDMPRRDAPAFFEYAQPQLSRMSDPPSWMSEPVSRMSDPVRSRISEPVLAQHAVR